MTARRFAHAVEMWAEQHCRICDRINSPTAPRRHFSSTRTTASRRIDSHSRPRAAAVVGYHDRWVASRHTPRHDGPSIERFEQCVAVGVRVGDYGDVEI